MNCLVCACDIYDVFYTDFDNQGNMDTYCFACYSKNVLDNYSGMVPTGTPVAVKCECGTKAKIGQHHSSWCQLYKKEFI
jgi:hypothetical protein